MARTGIRTRSGIRPKRSDSEPPTGSQTRFERPMQTVTPSTLVGSRCRAWLPKVGV